MACEDKHCPQHSSLGTRGRTFRGVVTAARQRTASIEWQRRKFMPKYERYEKRRTRVKAHNPDCIDAKKGDIVIIRECRPISKTKKFVIVEKVGAERLFAEKEERMAEAKVEPKEKEE